MSTDEAAVNAVLCSAVVQALLRPLPAIVFDLDETLVFSSPIKPQGESIAIRVGRRKIYVRVRPGTMEMIKAVSHVFDVYFFTASNHEYANQIINAIAPGTPASNRFFRENCTTKCGYSVKDLTLIGKPLSRILMVDDTEGSAMMQPRNLVRISPWYGNEEDRVLMSQLLPALMRIACEADLPSAFLDHSKECHLSELFVSQMQV